MLLCDSPSDQYSGTEPSTDREKYVNFRAVSVKCFSALQSFDAICNIQHQCVCLYKVMYAPWVPYLFTLADLRIV